MPLIFDALPPLCLPSSVMVCDAVDTAEEVAVCDEEATAKLAACKKESSEEAAADEAAAEEAAACWAPWASEPLSKGLIAL